jgi:undecaprenyl-diphosphatase
MLTLAQAATLGILQGVTELFPISSLGHSVILPALLHWQIDQSSLYFLPFLVLTHLATALVLLAFFWRDWVYIVQGILRSLFTRKLKGDPYAKLGWLLIAGTVPVGLIGLLFQKKLEVLFADPKVAAMFLFCNGILLLGCELLRRKERRGDSVPSDEISRDVRLANLSWLQGLGIGLSQALGLLPGLSRSGASLGGGLIAGLNHEQALRFSFLLSTPIILAAAVLEVPKLFHADHATLYPALFGALLAAVAAWFSLKFLVRYFKNHTLWPFGLYCLAAGAIAFFLL